MGEKKQAGRGEGGREADRRARQAPERFTAEGDGEAAAKEAGGTRDEPELEETELEETEDEGKERIADDGRERFKRP